MDLTQRSSVYLMCNDQVRVPGKSVTSDVSYPTLVVCVRCSSVCTCVWQPKFNVMHFFLSPSHLILSFPSFLLFSLPFPSLFSSFRLLERSFLNLVLTHSSRLAGQTARDLGLSIQCTCCCAWLLSGCWGSNSGPSASILITKLSLQCLPPTPEAQAGTELVGNPS